jgi:hypothetical protein
VRETGFHAQAQMEDRRPQRSNLTQLLLASAVVPVIVQREVDQIPAEDFIMRFAITLLSTVTALLFLTPFVGAQKPLKNSESVVKVTAKADKPDADGKQVVTITMGIDKDWHTYANPVGHDDLQESQTVVEFGGKSKPASVKIDYPKGKVQKDEVVGNYSIYEGKIEIKATVQRAKGDTGPLEVKVKFQACSDVTKTCLVPATVNLKVE